MALTQASTYLDYNLSASNRALYKLEAFLIKSRFEVDTTRNCTCTTITTISTTERLPNEVLDRVIDNLCAPVIPLSELHPNDLLQFSRVNRQCHAVATPVLAKQVLAIRKAIREGPSIFRGSMDDWREASRILPSGPSFLRFVITLPQGCWSWTAEGRQWPGLYLCTCHPTLSILLNMIKHTFGRDAMNPESFLAFARAENLPRFVNLIDGCPQYDLQTGLEEREMVAFWCLIRHVFPQINLRRINHGGPFSFPNICLLIEWMDEWVEDQDDPATGSIEKKEEGPC